MSLTTERQLLDSSLAKYLNEKERNRLWKAADSILKKRLGAKTATGLALGYVQSGKTTQMIALTAAAYDQQYRIIIAMLGSTNLLLDQNTDRFTKSLGFESRDDFRWLSRKNPKGKKYSAILEEELGRGQAILVPVLKHAGRINNLAEVLESCNLADVPVLILDDEADQASLNVKVNQATQGKIYSAIGRLRNAIPQHLYVQFTATPYAPLLLEPDDHLLPEFVEFLVPGDGYIGGREFFIDHEDQVVRVIPNLDEQSSKGKLVELPGSLKQAFGNFIAGSALLLVNDTSAKIASMLVHSTYNNVLQGSYHLLLKRLLSIWKLSINEDISSLPSEILEERSKLVSNGVNDISNEEFIKSVNYVLKMMVFWLVNSVSDVKKINWLDSPIHVLVGGNKLDRGFTVEGLTVTYMNRPVTEQIDTLEQRARAFGYRSDLLPYCQFFATKATIRMLRAIVHTEYDLRARLSDWLNAGNSPSTWAKEIGLLLPQGAKPARAAVLKAISSFNAGGGWHQLRMPSYDKAHIANNLALIKNIGILEAERKNWGRINHRTIQIDSSQALEELLKPWAWNGFSPGWEHKDIVQLFESISMHSSNSANKKAYITLMQFENTDDPRTREWKNDIGFVNLLQGKDQGYPDIPETYPGDRGVPTSLLGDDCLAIQVHRVLQRESEASEIYTLAVYLGSSKIVRRG